MSLRPIGPVVLPLSAKAAPPPSRTPSDYDLDDRDSEKQIAMLRRVFGPPKPSP